MEETTSETPQKTGAFAWLKKRIVPISGLLATIALVAVIGYAYFKYPGFFDRLKTYGYFGVFIISLFLNATVIIPVSNMTVIFAMGATLPAPWLVGIVGGFAAGIGEMTGYFAGRSGRNILAKNKVYTRVENWVKKRGWIAVFILSIFPLIFDVVGIIAGAMRMPVWRYFVATWLGRTIIYITVAYLGHYGFRALPSWLS
jgi:membrane protein YqaA with SNARE-associated domain